ncbi:MAG TPA: pseudouridine-5-phosphate glycosidase [Phycisphaerales bacterium]|nr:pseudouridine-5-phosphate glycosidase [Phycisphaerales bacterium]
MSSRGLPLVRRVTRPAVALETTLLLHGVPKDAAPSLARELDEAVRANGAHPAVVGVVAGVPTVGMTGAELDTLLRAPSVAKANSANLGALVHARAHGATTMSATMELAAAVGVRVFATGGLGGVHPPGIARFDISSDLGALARFPLAVVTSGVKSLLDIPSTREALEALGVPVVGFRTSDFPAFYQRRAARPVAPVDARFDDEPDLARFLSFELARSGRGVVVANPIPEGDEIPEAQWRQWLSTAEREAADAGVIGRALTPFLLGRIHNLSEGRTLRANVALVLNNARLAARLAALIDL